MNNPALNKNKHLCVHGHFYQPPRENPWTDGVDPEDSARPHRDWNSRIAAECYGQNAACPLLGPDGLIAAMADNYEKISFNFGPTLLSWLERKQPKLYDHIVRADAGSVSARGHGNAIAQPYYHAILPLQNLSDKRTLVRWGLEDFQRRFGRRAEGLWLPETAVDEETLEVLIEAGVSFTILAPSQAKRVRLAGGGEPDWRDVEENTLQPTRPYRWLSRQKPGRQLAVFFFHEGLHRSVVAGQAFARPDTLFKKIFGRTRPDDSVELIQVATDGEFYGHHHRAGAAALAQTLMLAEEAGLTVVNPAQFLEMFPPPQEVQIEPRTAWSCEHGLGRWTQDCGCRSTGRKKWTQAWRHPLRQAVDWLSAELDRLFEASAGDYFKDFRSARDAYCERLSDWGEGTAERFLAREGFQTLSGENRTRALQLLELQRHRLAMFTSCGWFCDEVSSPEATIVLSQAARAIDLAASFGADLTQEFKRLLSLAPSNVASFKDAAGVYDKLVLPNRAESTRLAAHWAILAHLKPGLETCPPGWRIEAGSPARVTKSGSMGRNRALSAVRLRVTRLTTLESRELTAVVHQKDRLDIACRIAAANIDAAPLFSGFETRDDAGFETTLNAALGAGYLTLEALLPEDRAQALRWLAPDPAGGPKRREFLDLWVAAMADARCGVGDDKCLDLLEQAARHKQLVDRLPWISVARDRLRAILESQLEGADGSSLARASRWLEAFERSGLHVNVWDLQHLFWRWRAQLTRRPHAAAERRLAAAFGEKLGFSDCALPLETPV